MHLEVSRVVNAPPETVYAAYTDFEAMPKWSSRLRAVNVTGRRGDTIHLENEIMSRKGKAKKRSGTVTLFPPGRVESESETRFTRTRRRVTFERVSGGDSTTVTATLDVEVKGLWAIILSSSVSKEEAEASATQELESFAKFVEGPRPADQAQMRN